MNKHSEDIKAIRTMMEKSSKFLSLSGLSGVFAGLTAIAGASVAHFFILTDELATDPRLLLLADGLGMLLLSVGLCVLLSLMKARRMRLRPSGSMTLAILYNLGLPLAVGGAFALAALVRGDIQGLTAITLAFYGIALVAVSKYTYRELNYLGLTDAALGVTALLVPCLGELLWVAGFGLCHILYGGAMYLKYDRKQ
ncbi:MAG: hypothetical protein LBD21_08400 [Tannerellaceae bacterium]|jgi:hypothetical protein|nr:hypothetical protein [Tannerellaceae bacterium]